MFKRRSIQVTAAVTTDNKKSSAKETVAPLNHDIYLRELFAVTEQILKVTPGETGYTKYRNDLEALVLAVRENAAKIDYDYLTVGEQFLLTTLLTKRLSELKSYVVLNAHDMDWSDIHDWCEYNLIEDAQDYLKVADAQDNRKRAQAVSVSKLDIWQDLPEDATDEATQQRVVFPTFTTQNELVQQAYEKLRETWVAASLKDLDVEDAYTLNAVATDYLPDSIRLYQRLTQRSSAAIEQGSQLMLGQLKLLQEQLDMVLARETADALSEMQAHSRFLAGKTPVADSI